MTGLPKVLVVPVDGSEGAAGAARLAAELAGALRVPLQLVFVFPESALDLYGVPEESMDPALLQYYSPETFTKLREQRARQVFDDARDAMGTVTFEVQERLLPGDAAEAILTHVDTLERPLIVMGRRGLSRFSELVVGSVSQRLSHHAGCPVMLVPS